MTEIQRTAFHNLLKSLSSPTAFNEAMRSLYTFSQMNTPTYLYRYRRCGEDHSFDDIENGQITLSSASRFDDPDDTSIHDTGELDKYIEMVSTQKEATLQMLQEMIPIVSNESVDDKWSQLVDFTKGFFSHSEQSRRENLVHLREQIRQAVDLNEYNTFLRSRQKIACFCENADSSYMWENFAGNGSGYLIEYDSLKLYKIDVSHNRVPHILPVIYRDEHIDTFLLPVISCLSDTSTMMLDKEILGGCLAIRLISAIFYKKCEPFEKEEEWRLMLTPLDSEKDDEFIFRKLKPTRLIAGPHMSSQDKNKMYNCAKNNGILMMDYGETFDEAIERLSSENDSLICTR